MHTILSNKGVFAFHCLRLVLLLSWHSNLSQTFAVVIFCINVATRWWGLVFDNNIISKYTLLFLPNFVCYLEFQITTLQVMKKSALQHTQPGFQMSRTTQFQGIYWCKFLYPTAKIFFQPLPIQRLSILCPLKAVDTIVNYSKYIYLHKTLHGITRMGRGWYYKTLWAMAPSEVK